MRKSSVNSVPFVPVFFLCFIYWFDYNPELMVLNVSLYASRLTRILLTLSLWWFSAFSANTHSSLYVFRAMQFLNDFQQIKIEDILPFFPDFVTIDHFKVAENSQIIPNTFSACFSTLCLFLKWWFGNNLGSQHNHYRASCKINSFTVVFESRGVYLTIFDYFPSPPSLYLIFCSIFFLPKSVSYPHWFSSLSHVPF